MISVIISTLWRPDKLVVAVGAMYRNATQKDNIEFVIGYEVGDTNTATAIYLLEGKYPITAVEFDNGADLNTKVNALGKKAKGDILFAGADDIVVQYVGWDDRLREEYNKIPDGVALVWVNDGELSDSIPRHFSMKRKIAEALGWIFPPELKHYHGDRVLFRIFLGLGRLRYLQDLVVEHYTINPHNAVGFQYDKTHLLDRDKYGEADGRAYAEVSCPNIHNYANRVRPLMEG